MNKLWLFSSLQSFSGHPIYKASVRSDSLSSTDLHHKHLRIPDDFIFVFCAIRFFFQSSKVLPCRARAWHRSIYQVHLSNMHGLTSFPLLHLRNSAMEICGWNIIQNLYIQIRWSIIIDFCQIFSLMCRLCSLIPFINFVLLWSTQKASHFTNKTFCKPYQLSLQKVTYLFIL